MYCYSEDDETYREVEEDEEDEFIIDMISGYEYVEGDRFVFYKGISVPYDLDSLVPPINLYIEQMQESAYEQYPEFSEGWLEDSKEHESELYDSILNVVRKWTEKNNLVPNFFAVKDTEEIMVLVTSDDSDYRILK